MPALPLAFVFIAQAASAAQTESSHSVYGPAPSAPTRPAATPVKTAATECPAPANSDPKNGPIVVCAVKPQGYRIDPDVLAARRMKKKGDAGRPHSPHETYADHSCATVGPMGCRGGPTINVLAAAVTAATMVQKAVTGQNVGKMFVTDPTMSEYQLYQEAKRAREAKEQEKAAQAVIDAVKAEKTAKAAATPKAKVDAAAPAAMPEPGAPSPK